LSIRIFRAKSEVISPDQAEQYDKYRRFEVVGSDTGTRYRILRGMTMNIVELAANGRVTRRWCFAPEGSLATGDVMLAQKIALETFELSALAIANHDGPQGVGFPSRSLLHMDELGWLDQRFRSSNHIMRPYRACRSMCERRERG
jgi:hypothetical protein